MVYNENEQWMKCQKCVANATYGRLERGNCHTPKLSSKEWSEFTVKKRRLKHDRMLEFKCLKEGTKGGGEDNIWQVSYKFAFEYTFVLERMYKMNKTWTTYWVYIELVIYWQIQDTVMWQNLQGKYIISSLGKLYNNSNYFPENLDFVSLNICSNHVDNMYYINTRCVTFAIRNC